MNILFMPIDIEISESITQLNVDRSPADSLRLTKYNPYWNSTLIDVNHPWYSTVGPIISQLPFERITTITHKIQDREVGPHVDVYPDMLFQENELDNIIENEPAGYRILIKGSNNKLEIFDGKEWVAPNIPCFPSCYLINSTSMKHRVKDDTNRELIYVRGILNKEKHQQLIKKSYIKYKDYVIHQQLL
jgi:hypothetical protein